MTVLPGGAHQPQGGGSLHSSSCQWLCLSAPECSILGTVITQIHIRSLSNLVHVGDEHQCVQGANIAEYKLTMNANALVHQTLGTVTSSPPPSSESFESPFR